MTFVHRVDSAPVGPGLTGYLCPAPSAKRIVASDLCMYSRQFPSVPRLSGCLCPAHSAKQIVASDLCMYSRQFLSVPRLSGCLCPAPSSKRIVASDLCTYSRQFPSGPPSNWLSVPSVCIVATKKIFITKFDRYVEFSLISRGITVIRYFGNVN